MSGHDLALSGTLQSTAFDHQPTPITIASCSGLIVSLNRACQQLFKRPHSFVGKHVNSLPIQWQDGADDILHKLLLQPFDLRPLGPERAQPSKAHDPLRLKIEICSRDSIVLSSARLLVTDLLVSGISYRMLSFENVMEVDTSSLPVSKPSLRLHSLTVNEIRSQVLGRDLSRGTVDPSTTDREFLQAKFTQFRDAIYFNNDNRAGFLLSADNKFCFPNYKGVHDVAPVEIDDVALFFQNWDVWYPDFTERIPLSDYPAVWLNEHRIKFRNRRYGLKEAGKNMVLEISGDPLYDIHSGEYIGGVVWITTLGEELDVKASDLKATLADFRTICNRLPHLLWTVDSDGLADYFSQSWYDFTGLSEVDSLGLGFTAAIDADDMKRIWAEFEVSSHNKTECHAEARYRRRDGQWIWMSVRAKPLLDSHGNVLKWYGSSTQVHSLVVERLEAEKKKGQMMDMLSLAEIGLFEVDPQWQLTVLQGRIGWLETQQTAQLLTMLDEIQEGGVPLFKKHLCDGMLSQQQSVVFEEQIHSRWYKFRLVYDNKGFEPSPTQYRILGCSVDITEQRHRAVLESENARLIHEASLEVEKSRLKTAFLAHMSHEIRTPIAGIIGTADMLADTCTDEAQKDNVRDIQVSANNLLTIVNDILDLSKIEAGKLQSEEISFDINALAREVTKLFSHLIRRKALSIEHQNDLTQEIIVVGDPGRVRQILSNLISNAIKFTSIGSISVSTEVKGSNVCLCVQDSGVGIDTQTLSTLFKPFVQGDASTARRHGGTGLGLTISRNMAELMGGTLHLESDVSHGTKAILVIPINKAVDRHPHGRRKSVHGDLVVQESLSSSTFTVKGVASQPLVLIVEDNAVNQKVALNMVRKLGYRTEAVWNGQEALDFLSDHEPPSLILMDCQMPLLDGYEATFRLRTHETYQHAKLVPVIALTASVIQGDKEKCEAAGMTDYLTKPVSKSLLAGKLKKWIRDGSDTDSQTESN